MKLSTRNCAARRHRDIGAEILQAVRDIKAGRGKRITVIVPPAVAARRKSGLSQADFARLLGVSVRTLQDWEQGRAARPARRARSCSSRSGAESAA